LFSACPASGGRHAAARPRRIPGPSRRGLPARLLRLPAVPTPPGERRGAALEPHALCRLFHGAGLPADPHAHLPREPHRHARLPDPRVSDRLRLVPREWTTATVPPPAAHRAVSPEPPGSDLR